MKEKSSVKKNILYQSFYEILLIILPMLTSPYISRILGAEQLGIFSYTYSIAYYFQLFSMLGLKFYGNRTIAQIRDDQEKLNKSYSELLVLHILFSIFSFVIYVIYSVFFAEYQLYSLLQGMMVLSALFDVSWLFFGLENFKSIVKRNSIVKILTVVAIFALVRNKSELWIYVAIMASSQLLSQLIMFFMAKKYVTFDWPKFNTLKKHIKPLFILFVPVIALSLFKYMDKIMLGYIGNKTQLGYYENSEKVLNFPLGIILAFGNVMLPKISNLVANKKSSAIEKYMGMSFKYMLWIAFAMAFGMASVAEIFAPIFWGKEFVNCAFLIELLSVTLPFSTVANIVRNQDLIPNGKDRIYSFAIIVGAIFNLIINWLLIPKYQAIGVAIGTIVSEVLVCIIQLLFVRKNHNYFKYIFDTLLFLIPGAIMFFVVKRVGIILGVHVYTLLIQVAFGILIYGFFSIIYFRTTKDEEYYKLIDSLRKRLSI